MKKNIGMLLAVLLLFSTAILTAQERTYTIQEGETLWDIAGKYFDDPTLCDQLAKFNGLSNPRTAPAGMQIKIPANATTLESATKTTASSPFTERRPLRTSPSTFDIDNAPRRESFATSNIERTATMETAASVGGINLGAILAASPDNDELKLTPKENPNTPKLIKPTDNPASLTP